jgi:amino acid transporter
MTTSGNAKKRGVVKFVFWTVIAAAVIGLTVSSYASGQMARWFYYRAAVSGYAVNVDCFQNASKSQPAVLQVVTGEAIDGLVAIRVKKGDRLPRNTNGVISDEILDKGSRASVAGSTLQVFVPWEIKEAKGFKYKDRFIHKGIQTWPWAGAWNVLITLLLGLSLGMMAEGFTDMVGIKLEKIQHHAKP